MLDLNAVMSVAVSAARAAGDALNARGEAFQGVDHQDGRDIKLSADKAAETMIIDALKATGLPILGEEGGWIGKPAEHYWVVDPLDGSANYNREIPLCCVSIALMRDEHPILGVVYDFNHDDLFAGSIEHPATCNDAPIRVTDIESPDKAILMTGLPVAHDFADTAMAAFGRELSRWKKVRMIGSAAMAACYVARGFADCYKEDGAMIWDIAGACAIIEAAGGRVVFTPTDRPNVYGIRADNGVLKL